MKRYQTSANLFDYQSVTIGKYIDANGVEQTSGSTGHVILNHSNTINIAPNTPYSFKIQKTIGDSAVTNAFCWFDENMVIISRDMADFTSGDAYIEMTFTSPATAAYLIINFRDNYYNTGMCNTGSAALPYEPYGKIWKTKSPLKYNNGTWVDSNPKQRTNGEWV